jgi:serine/threonine protein phosphatase 1
MHIDQHRIYVHAGVDTGLALSNQDQERLIWKRYLPNDDGGHGRFYVVHGHTPYEDGPKLRKNRINLDTFAWATGRLVIAVFDDDKPGGPVDFIEVKGPSA